MASRIRNTLEMTPTGAAADFLTLGMSNLAIHFNCGVAAVLRWCFNNWNIPCPLHNIAEEYITY